MIDQHQLQRFAAQGAGAASPQYANLSAKDDQTLQGVAAAAQRLETCIAVLGSSVPALGQALRPVLRSASVGSDSGKAGVAVDASEHALRLHAAPGFLRSRAMRGQP